MVEMFVQYLVFSQIFAELMTYQLQLLCFGCQCMCRCSGFSQLKYLWDITVFNCQNVPFMWQNLAPAARSFVDWVQQTTKCEMKNCCIFVFTKMWLHAKIQGTAIKLERLTCYWNNRESSLSGKLCLYQQGMVHEYCSCSLTLFSAGHDHEVPAMLRAGSSQLLL